ncbi:6-phosphogluconolactonase, cycloisomerase 2 family [Streptomyces sp. 2224.1]|uniref:lactonase family protein n=1 Tax=Streptomyces sp. 2224.1 TaxID=1881020 RepID=UPI00089BA157|nr:lactonase family protein [Streptomyces sp. 2224.1]SED95002.1 6-phosphogluconolactonase, cycloisomerase 2 family [Streptomyces sp. 2224.1]
MSAARTGTQTGTGSSHVNRRRFVGIAAGLAAAGGAGGAGLLTAQDPAPGHATRHAAGHRRRRIRPLFLGTYTSAPGGGAGVGLGTYDTVTGRITRTGVLDGVADPSYLALAPSGRTLYAVDEQERGEVTAMALRPDGPPTVLGTRSTGGAGPCHLSVHPSGRWLLSANYLSGSVAVHPVDRATGSLGARTDLVTHTGPPPGPGQDGPHAHQIITAPDGRHVLAVDLGNDTVYTYRLDESAGELTQVSYASLRPGAGPRHLTFHPSGAFAYLANEVDNTVVVCRYDRRTGRLTPGAPQATGTGTGTSYPAQLLVTRDGGFAFLANRGHNSLTRYAVEAAGARLRLLDTVPVGGDFPRQIAFSPDQRWLFAANQKSGSVTVFSVDARTGSLRRTGEPFPAPVPVCALPR